MNDKQGTIHSITDSNRPGYVMLNIATSVKALAWGTLGVLIEPVEMTEVDYNVLRPDRMIGITVAYSTDFFGELVTIRPMSTPRSESGAAPHAWHPCPQCGDVVHPPDALCKDCYIDRTELSP